MRRLHILLIVCICTLLVGCGTAEIPPTSETSSAAQQPTTTSAPATIPATATPPPSSVIQASLPTTGMLYVEYESFMLEGIPPYPAQFVPIDSRDRQWVDLSQPNRYRMERYFRTQEDSPREGVEMYETGTGDGGTRTFCMIYEDQPQCQSSPITMTLDATGWLSRTTAMGQREVAHTDNPDAIDGIVYKGVQQDPVWGEVYVFERHTPVEISDQYHGQPATETHLFDTQLLRTVEMRRTIDGESPILHSLFRLVRWEMLDSATLPTDFFDPDRAPSGTFGD